MPKVSVIVPCYNVAPYLERCLDSLLGQTLRDIEIICIDDKSTDNSLEILNKYAEQDKRITVIAHEQNSGVSTARNNGMAAAKGEYIGFVDPDDYVDLDFYEKLYNKATASGADITVGNIKETSFNGHTSTRNQWLKIIENDKLRFRYTLWCAIYSTSFLRDNKINNPVGIVVSEDTVFVIKAAVLANKLVTVYDTYYNYIRVPDSLSSEWLTDAKVDSKIRAAHLIIDFLNEQNLNPDDYYTAFSSMFSFIADACFFRTTKHDTRMKLMNETIALYQKYKYKNLLHKQRADIAGYLICDDAAGLYEHVQRVNADTLQRKVGTIRVKFLNLVQLLRIKRYTRYIKVSILGIPVLWINTKVFNARKFNG